ncbi:MAG: hypothetical protein FJ008_09030 [Chloroflexi bacterium]|nr:hypothetical protein [Chloroflexota bacterium]
MAEPVRPKGTRHERRRKAHSGVASSKAGVVLGAVVIFFVAFFPNFKPALDAVSQARFAPGDAWCESLDWLRESTPDPFNDPDFYYQCYQKPFKYPESAYGVIAWWDYGYWITRLGHRPTVCDPGGGASTDVANFLLSQDEAAANAIITRLKSKYVLIDYDVAMPKKFNAVATYIGKKEQDFYDVYFERDGKTFISRLRFYPEYYLATSTRLYFFDGEEAVPKGTPVMTYAEVVAPDGTPYKEIIGEQTFPTYNEAVAFLNSRTSGNHRIVGKHPLVSPIPLKKMENYKLVYSSRITTSLPPTARISGIKIFEYTK